VITVHTPFKEAIEIPTGQSFHMHDDGDLTVNDDQAVIAGFARHTWTAVIINKENDQ
jgi:hypothetical protein